MTVPSKPPETPPGAGAKDTDGFDWVALRADMGTAHYGGETVRDKLVRKIQANPFVPLGCLATVTALSVGLWSFRQGKPRLSQKMMRARIAAQGFTVVALIAGVMITAKGALEK